MTVYSELGVRPIINATTTWTVAGGSLMPAEVLDAMRDAAQAFVDMHELREAAGRKLARLTNDDAAYVTVGAAAGSVLASRTRGELPLIGRLLEGCGSDLPDEVIMHTAHRMLVGSKTGAVPLRQPLGCIRRFQLRARLGITVGPSPAPWRSGPPVL